MNLDSPWMKYGAMAILIMFVAPVFLFVIFFIAYVMGGISGDWKSNEASNLPGTGVAGTLDPAKCGDLIPESTYTEKYTTGKKTVTREQLYAAINVLSNERKLPAALIAAKIKQESQFDPNAISPVSARGISQIMPDTYDGLNGNKSWHRAKKLFPNAERDPFDTYYVMFLGSGYLRTMVDKARVYLNIPEGSQNDDQIYSLAIAAYNAGPNQKDIVAGNIPPYEETQEYVKTIMGENGYYQQFQKCQTIIENVNVPTSTNGAKIEQAARKAIGTSSSKYYAIDPNNACAAFTGAMINPTTGLSLDYFAPNHWKASSGTIITDEKQLQPGDEVYWTNNTIGEGIAKFDGDPSAAYKKGEHVPMHVGIYIGTYKGQNGRGQNVDLTNAVVNNSGSVGQIVVDPVNAHAQSDYKFMGAKRY